MRLRIAQCRVAMPCSHWSQYAGASLACSRQARLRVGGSSSKPQGSRDSAGASESGRGTRRHEITDDVTVLSRTHGPSARRRLSLPAPVWPQPGPGQLAKGAPAGPGPRAVPGSGEPAARAAMRHHHHDDSVVTRSAGHVTD